MRGWAVGSKGANATSSVRARDIDGPLSARARVLTRALGQNDRAPSLSACGGYAFFFNQKIPESMVSITVARHPGHFWSCPAPCVPRRRRVRFAPKDKSVFERFEVPTKKLHRSPQKQLGFTPEPPDASASFSRNTTIAPATMGQLSPLMRNFIQMTIAFSINHGCVVAVLNIAVLLLGDNGSYQSGSLYVTYAATALLLSPGLLDLLGARKALIWAAALYSIYVISFPIALIVPKSMPGLGACTAGIAPNRARPSFAARAPRLTFSSPSASRVPFARAAAPILAGRDRSCPRRWHHRRVCGGLPLGRPRNLLCGER